MSRAECQKYFLRNVILKYQPELRESLKHVWKAAEINVEFDNDLDQNMYNVIASPNTERAHIFEQSFSGEQASESVLEFIQKILDITRPDRLVIHIGVWNNCIPISVGHELRAMLPMPKEQSAITFLSPAKRRKRAEIDVFVMTLNTGM